MPDLGPGCPPILEGGAVGMSWASHLRHQKHHRLTRRPRWWERRLPGPVGKARGAAGDVVLEAEGDAVARAAPRWCRS